MNPAPDYALDSIALAASSIEPDSAITNSRNQNALVPLLRIEGLVLCVAATAAFLSLGFSWKLYAVLFLLPDLSMLGYLAGPRWGARSYNAAHSLVTAGILGVAWWAGAAPIVGAVGALIAAHAGFDRMLGYGLKHSDSFNHTHLGWVGKRS